MNRTLRISILLAVFFVSRSALAQNPIPNYSFEEWTGDNPDEWSTNNGPSTFISKEAPGHTGSYAVRGDVQSVLNMNFPPLLASKNDGFTVIQNYTNLFFFYKFNKVDAASLYVTVNFFDAIDSSAGFGVAVIANPASNYTLGTAPIFLTSSPIRCVITTTIFDISGFPSLGNSFIIDDFSFDIPIGIPSIAGSDYFMNSPSPCPAADATTISFTIPRPVDVDLKMYNLEGRQLKIIHPVNTVSGENQLSLDVSELSNGIYILVLDSGYGMLQRRIVVQR